MGKTRIRGKENIISSKNHFLPGFFRLYSTPIVVNERERVVKWNRKKKKGKKKGKINTQSIT
jgi:hypothetical protein